MKEFQNVVQHYKKLGYLIAADDVYEEIVNNFQNNLHLFYVRNELASGFIISKNKHGKDEKYSLVESKYEKIVGG